MNEPQETERSTPELGYPEVMTIDQVADYLQLHKQVIYRHVKKKTIPASRIGSTLRFKRSVIDAWLIDSALENLRKTREAREAPVYSPFNIEVD